MYLSFNGGLYIQIFLNLPNCRSDSLTYRLYNNQAQCVNKVKYGGTAETLRESTVAVQRS